MQWLYNLDELQYEKFLTILFTYCDHVTCVGSEVQCLKFSGIIYECIGRRPLEMQNLYSSDWENASIYQYSFVCSEKTKEWFKQQSFYRLHWQMIDLHALTFWKEGQ